MLGIMKPEDYESIVKYVFDMCGIVLEGDKEYLVEQRLNPILPELECNSFSDLAMKLSSGIVSYSAREKILNAMTTNETSFFRDEHPFATLRDKIIPNMLELVKQRKERVPQRRGPKVNIWSVAASTGQESYSIAMTIADTILMRGMDLAIIEDFGILGTDISTRVLAKAIEGKYGPLEVSRGLTQDILDRHFIEEKDYYVVKDYLRKIIEFKSFNIHENFTQIGSFDIIFCRNILIYFTNEAKRKIFTQLYEVLAPNGYLFIGASENMYGLNSNFKSEQLGPTTVYRKMAS